MEGVIPFFSWKPSKLMYTWNPFLVTLLCHHRTLYTVIYLAFLWCIDLILLIGFDPIWWIPLEEPKRAPPPAPVPCWKNSIVPESRSKIHPKLIIIVIISTQTFLKYLIQVNLLFFFFFDLTHLLPFVMFMYLFAIVYLGSWGTFFGGKGVCEMILKGTG